MSSRSGCHSECKQGVNKDQRKLSRTLKETDVSDDVTLFLLSVVLSGHTRYLEAPHLI